MKPVTLAIVGAGGRGSGYANHATKNGKAKVIGVAEPLDFFRERQITNHDIPKENVFTDWKDMAARERFADAVLICTQDAMHAEPMIALAEKGYHILLEKPMAPDAETCRRIAEAANKNKGRVFAVCHVLRYTGYTQRIKQMVADGMVGEVVNIQRLEPVGYWHQAHSYVRGNWGNEARSSNMLLAKSCHDLDWILYLMGARCTKVSSFGSLLHFRKENQPKGASQRCVDCKVESSCPYSAVKIYLGRARKGNTGWPVSVLSPDTSEESLQKALETGPYGQCVYACDNDVVDNQVVNMEFEGGKTASFTMTAFNRGSGRKTTIFGTRGEIHGDGSVITHFDFLTDKETVIDTRASDAFITGGHGGGDQGLIASFLQAVSDNDPGGVLSGADESLASHLMVFGAERARLESRVVNLLEEKI